jgi:5-methylthioadenosine/S-adenosylhomocysteine deaminase
LIDAAFPTPPAEWNLYDQLILYRNPQHIRLVMVDGNILLQDGELRTPFDPHARQALWEQASRLWEKAQ